MWEYFSTKFHIQSQVLTLTFTESVGLGNRVFTFQDFWGMMTKPELLPHSQGQL